MLMYARHTRNHFMFVLYTDRYTRKNEILIVQVCDYMKIGFKEIDIGAIDIITNTLIYG